MLLEKLFGSAAAERVLLYIANYGEGYSAAIARTFGLSASQVQKQLDKFEQDGILVQQPKGRTRIYTWNPRWPLSRQLQALLSDALILMPENTQAKYFRERRRPRLKGKRHAFVERDD